MVCLEKCESSNDPLVMLIGKRSTKEKEGRSASRASKKKEKCMKVRMQR